MPRELDLIRLDALRELGTIGGGHAATAFSKLTGRRVMIGVPDSHVVRLEDLGSTLGVSKEKVAVVSFSVVGDISARLLLMMQYQDARRLVDIVFQRQLGNGEAKGEEDGPSLEETGNIVVSAYLNAVSELLGVVLMPSVPHYAVGDPTSVLTPEHLDRDDPSEVLLCVTTRFWFEDPSFHVMGDLVFLPTMPAFKSILDRLQLD